MDMGLKSALRTRICSLFLAAALAQITPYSAQAQGVHESQSPAPAPSQVKTGVKGQVRLERPRIALALGGDGLRSAACLGVLKVFDDEGIPVDIIVGTGMGAVVGGLYSAGVTPQHIEQEFTDNDLMSAYITVPLSLRLLLAPIFYAPRLIGFKPYDGLYRGKKFANYLNKQVPETERNIEDLKIPFGAVAVNLLDGKCRTITQGNLGKALQASAAIPALRKPVRLDDGGLYVDGAVLVNIPVAAARKMGGDLVIAVDVNEKLKPARDEDFHSVGSVGLRVVSLHMDKIDQSELAQADYIIQPDLGEIGLISTSKADARATIRAGETAARRAIPAIRELLDAKSKN